MSTACGMTLRIQSRRCSLQQDLAGDMMALLIDIGHAGWMTEAEIRDEVLQHLPDADVRTIDAVGNPETVTMLAVSRLRDDLPATLPNLQLVQKLGAGVETIVAHPALPEHVRVTRLKPKAPAREIAQFCLAYVLREERQLRFYAHEQAARRWTPVEPREPQSTIVGVMGLGHIGGTTGQLFRDLEFQVQGWSRSPKSLPGMTCLHGPDGLTQLLETSDYVCAILPSTPDTRGLLDEDRLGQMKPGAVLINAGRGDLLDEDALIRALDRGTPAHAVLDVLSQEPLPSDSPLWSHPDVTITPHVSGWHLGDALADVAENFRRLREGQSLLHEVNRTLGY